MGKSDSIGDMFLTPITERSSVSVSPTSTLTKPVAASEKSTLTKDAVRRGVQRVAGWWNGGYSLEEARRTANSAGKPLTFGGTKKPTEEKKPLGFSVHDICRKK